MKSKRRNKKEISIVRRAKRGDIKAVEYLWEKYKRLASYLASNYRKSGVSYQDLFSAGFLGLDKGVRLFDESRGIGFGTFVFYTMQNHIMEERNNSLIRIPTARQKILRDFWKKQNECDDKATSEIIEGLDIINLQKSFLEKYFFHNCFNAGDILVETEDGEPLIGQIHNGITAEDELDSALLKKDILGAMSVLNSAEQNTIIKYYGLDNSTPLNMVDIAKELGVSRQRVFVFMKSGMRKLRKILKNYK